VSAFVVNSGTRYARREFTMRRRTIVLVFALSVLRLTPAAAQTPDGQSRFALLGQLTGVTSREFDGTDVGFGGLLAWRPSGLLSAEAEANFYTKNLTVNQGSPFSRGRVETLFGLTAGPVVGRIRPFGMFRLGFVKFQSAPGPLACPAIFPPILSCELAKGEAIVAADVGGGIELLAVPHALVRIDIGDRLMNYPGASIDASGEVHSMAFWVNEFRFAVGAGVRF
jgi:hypothetical protein